MNLLLSATLINLFSPAHAENSEKAAEALHMSFAKGQVFSVIIPVANNTPDGKAARKRYFDASFPLASQLGLKREGQIKIKGSSAKNFKPKVMAFYSWPNQASENQLSARPEWPEIKSLRPKAWDALNIYSKELEKDLILNFTPGKHYSLAMAWVNEKNPNDYYQYLNNIKPAVKAAGGRFIYKMNAPAYEAHGIHKKAPNNSQSAAPSQLTFVEWDNENGLKAFRASEHYKQNAHLIRSGTHQFRFFRMSL
ncbi:hypothetical protein [Pseudoteredinibacter isoporae]|uniref:Uncharacterized protein (DUF1330 family) n=1 Tax=Pseudoteredinibacter isoporae TaxID=570281 RepID=A0A7X0MV08_9GAMM|nr:hypothetical protein [Pseudoteredinibacter isoporae]MBB6521221.1 uncharacterized protein (DUF1330 family) [Pseudoteredinibacter isoporae]NHO86780.1 hypothetical protein [Pseudoteredinibacter isoporae]